MVTVTGFFLKRLWWGPLSLIIMAGGTLSLMSVYLSGDYHEGPLSGIIIESGFCQSGYYLYPCHDRCWVWSQRTDDELQHSTAWD